MICDKIILLSLCLVGLCAGCQRDVAQPEHTEEAVGKLVVPGISREVIEQKLGSPFYTSKANGKDISYYSFSETSKRVSYNDKFTGCQIHYTNNRVERWFPDYSSKKVYERTEPEKASATADTNQLDNTKTPESVSFYVVSETNFPGARYFSTTNLPDVGYIGQVPELKIHEIEAAETEREIVQKGEKEGSAVTIVLSKNDAESMRSLSEQNIGKRVLITIDETPMIAPTITSPIGNGRLMIASPRMEQNWVLRLRKMVANNDKHQ